MGPVCSANFLRFANLSAEIQALQINILKGYPYEHPTMIDMVTRSPQNLGENLVTILKEFEWAQVGAVLCEECYSDDQLASETYFDAIGRVLETNNIAVRELLKVKRGDNSQNISQSIKVFESSARVLLLFLGNSLNDYSQFLTAMRLNNYTTDEYTPVIILSKSSLELSFPWQNDPSTADLFDKTFIIHNNCYEKSKVSSFLSKYSFSTEEETIISLQMYEGYHLLGHYLYTASVDSTLFNYVSPEKSVASMDIHGPFGDIYIDVNGQRIAGYEVKRVSKAQVSSNYLIDLGTVTTSKKCSRLACLHYELNSTVSFEPPKDVPLCGFHGEICDQTGVIYAIVVVIAIACVFVLLCSGIRSVLVTGKGRSISNPWLIPFYDLRFIDLSNTDGSQNLSIQSIKQKMEERTHLKRISRNRLLASVDQTFVACDKYVIRDKIRYDKLDVNLLYQIFQMRSNIQHDNLNGFIGLAFDRASHIYVIWTQCFRGSLHDHIFTSKSKRETATNFEGAFLRDILKGLEYLHTISALEYHGSLTLFNCMLDSHWIVKLSGFGMDRLLIKWKAGGQIFTEDHTPLIRSEELHYYDPALKKIWRQFTGTKADKQLINAEFGRKCDMYGFGVCLYEIYFKKKFVPILFDTPSESEDESLLLDDANDEIASKYPLPIVIPDGVFMHNDLLRTLENCFGNNRPDIKLVRKVIDTVLKMQGSLVDLMIKNLTSYTVGLTKTVEIRTVQLQVEQRKSDALLAELIPSSIARELQTGFRIEPKIYPNATILYSDIVGFTSLCSQSSPMEVVTLLSGMYQRFDLIISQQGGYKMETIGDAYCVAAGLPIPTEHEHVKMICMIALLQRECLHQFEIPHRPGQYLNCRWGFNSGEVFAGIIGVKAPRYACFGEAATLASKMESNGMEDRIQMTLSSKQIIEEHYSEFTTSSRGGTSIEGYGFLITYWLEGLETSAASRVSEFQKSMYQMLEEIAKEPQSAFAWSSSERRDKMAMARERLMAERRMMAERLQRQQTIQEALEEHEEEVEMNVVLKDEDAKNDSVDLASIISTQPDDDDEEENEIVAGRGRTIDSQASTIPEN